MSSPRGALNFVVSQVNDRHLNKLMIFNLCDKMVLPHNGS